MQETSRQKQQRFPVDVPIHRLICIWRKHPILLVLSLTTSIYFHRIVRTIREHRQFTVNPSRIKYCIWLANIWNLLWIHFIDLFRKRILPWVSHGFPSVISPFWMGGQIPLGAAGGGDAFRSDHGGGDRARCGDGGGGEGAWWRSRI